MANHHPSLEMLTDFASGGLRPSHALPVAAHLEFCESCRRQLDKLNGVGGNLLEAQQQGVGQPDTMAALKHRVMSSITDEPQESGETHSPVKNDVKAGQQGSLPRCLEQFTAGGYQNLSWAQITPSMRIANLCKDRDGALIALSKVKPGGKMPHHRHTGDELTMVLEGSFSDESGVYREGDFVMRGSGDHHKPTVTRDRECICLMVLDAPIQFTGVFTRWLNPLLRRTHL
ncbi:MAG: ChrR family anti-sigma-E factor [bacterium]